MTPRHPSARRAVRGLVIAFGISAVGFGAFEPFLVLWGHRDAGLAGAAAGLLFVAQAVGEISGGLTGGLLADRIGGRQMLLVSTVGMAVSYGSLAVVASPVPALLVIFLAGLFEAAFHPTALALIGELTPEDDRTHAYAVLRAAGNLGTIIGPLAGAAIVAGLSLASVFGVTAVLLLAAGVVVLMTQPRRGPSVDLAEEVEEIQAAVPGLKAITRDRRLLLLVAGGALLAITLAWWEADGLVIIRGQRPFGTGVFSLMIALSAAIIVALQIPVTRLTRRRSVPRLLAGGAVLQALGLLAFSLASDDLAFVVLGVVLISCGDMLYGPNLSALVSRIAPAGRAATYQAALSTTQDVGQAVGPATGLALSGAIGSRATWILALPFGLLAAVTTATAATSTTSTTATTATTATTTTTTAAAATTTTDDGAARRLTG